MAQLSSTNIFGTLNVSGSSTSFSFIAAGNDFADALPIDSDPVTPGYSVELKEGKIVKTTERNSKTTLGVVSDTYSFKAGSGKLPIAMSGFILAYTDRKYRPGTKLVSGSSGILTKAHFWERPIALYLSEIIMDRWNSVKVNGRRLVKVL